MTNKKKRSSTKKSSDGGGASAATTTSTTTRAGGGGNPSSQPSSKKSSKGISPPQLTALGFLTIGTTYTMQFRGFVQDGLSSTFCTKYYTSGETCTEADVFFMTVRYHSAIITSCLVAFIMLMCWKDDMLLQRFNLLLCISPLGSTVLVLLTCTDEVIKWRLVLRLGMWCVGLFAITLMSNSVGLAPPKLFWGSDDSTSGGQQRRITLQDLYFMTLLPLTVVEMVLFLKGGAEGYTNMDPTGITDGAKVICTFLAVDKATVSMIAVFGLVFLDEVQKRMLLFIFGVVTLVHVYYLLPMQESNLQNYDQMREILFGLAIGAGVLSLLPSFHRRAKAKTS